MKLQKTSKMLKVSEFNDLLSCYLCSGYLINPTAVENCLHTYCRTCIVRHLQREATCPLCKIAANFKQIDVGNLRSDDVLRALIFKMVPGLYQKERELAIQCNSQQQINVEEATDDVRREQETIGDHFFAPNEPISLSLEYHPALLKGCSTSQIPPVRYLQCPACLKIRHLKRFLCSKFDIGPESKRIEVEVIYEDEVLPNDFTLMDVGYCYNWKRHAPMKFTYRILFYGNESQNPSNRKNKSEIEVKGNSRVDTIKTTELKQNEELTICDDANITIVSTASPILHKALKSKSKSSKSIKLTTNKTNNEEVNAPVKMIFARKSSADSGKKPSPKRNNHEDVTYTVTNDFKSLRSNDMRYSDYAVSSTTSNSNSPKSSPKSAQRSGKSTSNASIIVDSPPPPPVQSQGASSVTLPKCDIVVSIPQSQMPKSPYSIDDEFENVSLAQLKTASKKSPSTTTTTNVTETAKGGSTRNVPKLKIELNSLKTRLSISKPKSAGVLSSVGTSEKRERTKQRKHSLDEVAAPLNDRLDIETYAKNIGLQPIEVLTPPESCEKLKYSPNASPLSSASSTTSSSNNAFPLAIPNELTTSTSFHKKRKKKHSKDSKEPKDSKRRRMHAEISSKPEEESLKMKVKLTTPHNHKSHKSESSGTKKSSDELRKSPPVVRDVKVLTTAIVPDVPVTPVNDSILALNKTLGEESRSINHLMMEKERTKEVVKVVKADETLLTLPQTNLLPKPYNNIKDSKLPASPPLPPSLFKTTPLNFNTITVTSTTAGQSKSTNNSSKQLDLTKNKQQVPLSTKPTPVPLYNRQGSLNAPKPHPHFIVPSLPRRPSPGSNNSYTPSSIASASSKQLGMQLKRSASLDEPYAIGGRAKQVKLDVSQRKALYGSYANKPLTPPATGVSISKLADTATNVQSSSGTHNNAVTITARPPGGMTQEQMRWQLPPYTQLHLPFNKPAVEIVRINSNQTTADMHTPALNALKSGRMMGPPLSMVKGKKSAGHQLGTMPSSSGVRSPPISLSAVPFGQGRNNPYRLSPPALINLQDRPFTTKKIGTLATDNTYKKPENLCKTNGTFDKQSQQSRVSLRDFRPTSRDYSSTDIIDVTGGAAKDEHSSAVDTTVSATAATPSARESLEAALNKIKQNITSTTAQDSAAGSAAKQQQLPSPTQMSNEDLQNLHLLSESATTREKIAIRSSLSYEKPKMQPSSMVRQQNASVRNIPNPSALAFRNMSTLPAVSSTLPPASTVVASQSVTSNSAPSTSSSTPTTSAASQSTQKTLPLVTLPLTSSTAPLSPGNVAPSVTTSSSAVSAPNTMITTARTVKKPTTIDQVAANLNMRASAAAAEAHAAKLNAAEDVAQISSSMGSATASQNNASDLSKTTLTTAAASSTTSNESSATAAERVKEQTTEATNGADEIVKAKVLPKSVADSGVTTAIVTDVTSIENTASNNNGNNNNNNNNNNNSNSKNNNNNSSSNNDVKYGVTSGSVASD
ncbi:protein suppressor 2 of zeste [Zeugodacus cucurbitae]|uniref:protein suppressor 2 of zeste n=1 Tax=Zeugodacus cucurbitae TaxID=28588 RepID=UPI000596A407|nr:protein suppressor 2 of zeste [Zeugodacus cucurbitae]XP_011182343.1 protein suppressor 2 of zeste [Zeugodacus cucurbitae]